MRERLITDTLDIFVTHAPLDHVVGLTFLFITPTIVLLLAINIFPLIWAVLLSFTNYRANRPNAPIRGIGVDNYVSVLTDPDVWAAMQATAHFVLWSIVLELVLGFGLALVLIYCLLYYRALGLVTAIPAVDQLSNDSLGVRIALGGGQGLLGALGVDLRDPGGLALACSQL